MEAKVIIFDAYGTLLDISSIDLQLEGLFGEKAPHIASTWRQKQLEYTWLRTLMGYYVPFQQVTQEALLYSCQKHRVELSDNHSKALMQAYDELKMYKDVQLALSRLKKRYKMGVLSNANSGMLNAAISHNNISHYFEHIISVDVLEKYKPAPEVYQLAERSFGVDRSSILFISSNTWDIAGAKNFGLKVGWVNRFDGHIEQLGPKPDIIFKTLEELSDVI